MPGVVFQDFVHGEEHRLVFPDHAGVGADLGLALGESVQGVNGLVRRHVGRQVDDDLHLVGGHVVDLLDVNLLLVLGLDDAVNHRLRGFPVRNLGDGDGALVHLVDACAHLHHAAALALVVLGTVGDAAGREVRQNLIRLTLQDGDGSVDELVEVVRQNLGRKARGDALGALGQQQREAHRQFRGFLVAAVVGGHPGRHLGVEDHLLGKLGKPCLDVTRGGVGVAGEDVAPVSLAIDQQALLAEGNQRAQDGLVAVRMVLHGLADDVRHLGVAPVVHHGHGVQHAPLDRLETVHDVRHRPVQNGIGRIVQIPVTEHPGQFELSAVTSQKPVKLPGSNGVFAQFLFLTFNLFPFLSHSVLVLLF